MRILPALRADGSVLEHEGVHRACWVYPLFDASPLAKAVGLLAALSLISAPVPGGFLLVAVDALRIRRLQTARWDDATLWLEGPVTDACPWRDVTRVSLEPGGRIRLVLAGRNVEFRAPGEPEAAQALVDRWKLHTGNSAPLPASRPAWTTELHTQHVRVPFEQGRAPTRPQSSLVGAHGAALFWLATTPLIFVPTTLQVYGSLLFLFLFLNTVITGLVMLGAIVAASLQRRRRGLVTLEQHALVLEPVSGPPRRLPWDAIQTLEHDDGELRITTSEGRITYDFTRLPPKQARGLLGAITTHWKNRPRGVERETERAALIGLQHAASREG